MTFEYLEINLVIYYRKNAINLVVVQTQHFQIPQVQNARKGSQIVVLQIQGPQAIELIETQVGRVSQVDNSYASLRELEHFYLVKFTMEELLGYVVAREFASE